MIQWRGEDISEATWEDYHTLVGKFPSFNFEDKVGFQGGGIIMDLVKEQLEGQCEVGARAKRRNWGSG